MTSTAHLDRITANVKVLKQQALATQSAIQQLQATDDGAPSASAPAGDGALPWAQGAWVLTAVVLIVAAVRMWYRRPMPAALTAEDPESQGYSSLRYGDMTEPALPATAGRGMDAAQTQAASEDGPESDWGVSRSMPIAGSAEFDRQAAASEVARVRQALARRRELRAKQRAEDGRRMRHMAEQALCASETQPAWEDSRPLPEVLDVTSDEDVAQAARSSAPAPFWHKPSQPASLAVTDSVVAPLIQAESDDSGGPETQQDELTPQIEPLDVPENGFAVKLDLARESAEVELWDEARELVYEVLEAGDGPLREQARALLAQIDYQEQASRNKAL